MIRRDRSRSLTARRSRRFSITSWRFSDARLKLPLFETVIPHRVAYEEVGLLGPPHLADARRPSTAKAITDLERLRSEIDTLLAAPEATLTADESAA